MNSKMGHELWLVVKVPNGFIPSVARPSLKFLGSAPNSGYRRSIAFYCGLSAGCRINPSDFLVFACHIRFFASSPLANNRLNLRIIGRYQHTFAGRRLVADTSTVESPLLVLYLETPHTGQSCSSTNSSLYKMQSLQHA